MTLSLFDPDGETWRHNVTSGTTRRLVCRSGNTWSLPAKDRSGQLDATEPPDLMAVLNKANGGPARP